MNIFLDGKAKLVCFCICVVFFVVGYIFIRNILWSIVWCDKRGKYNSLRKLKHNQSLFNRINMKYLESYTNNHKNDFKFWVLVKKVYVILGTVLSLLYVIMWGVFPKSIYSGIIIIMIVVAFAVLSMVIVFQTDINRDTKYDKIRKQKHKQRYD